MSNDSKIRELADRKFLETLKEVAMLYGHQGDYIEISNFVQYLFVVCHVEIPNLKPKDDIDEIIDGITEKREITIDDVLIDLKKCKTNIDFLTTIKSTFGLNLMWSKTESWLEYFGTEVKGTRRVRFEKEQEIKDLIFISGL